MYRRCRLERIEYCTVQCCDTGFVLSRVRCFTASRCGCCVTARRWAGLLFVAVDCSCLRVPLRRVHACVHYRRVAVGERHCVARVLSVVVAAAVACYALVRHVSCDFACRSRSVAVL